VIGTVSASSKLGSIEDSVDHALVSGAPDFLDEVWRIAHAGVDVVYEFVGKATFATSAAAVRDGGTIVTIGAASGQPDIDSQTLRSRSVRVTGGPMIQHVQGSATRAIDDVFDAFRKGVFGAFVATTTPLVQAARVHEDIAARRNVGPSVLVP
jgi:NADPH2:quinone reductase